MGLLGSHWGVGGCHQVVKKDQQIWYFGQHTIIARDKTKSEQFEIQSPSVEISFYQHIMSEPKKETKLTETTEPVTSTHFLVANRELRPEGTHFEEEAGKGYAQQWLPSSVGDAANRPAAAAK